MSLVTRIVLLITRLSLKRRGIVDQVVVAVVEEVLVVLGWHHQGSGNYEQNKFGVTNTCHVNHNGVQCFDGVWMVFCGKCQAWSCTTNAHTTDFHDASLSAGSPYCVPSTCPFSHH